MLLDRYKNDFMMSELQIDFPLVQNSGWLDRFFTSAGVKCMLEEKNYSAADILFSLIAAVID